MICEWNCYILLIEITDLLIVRPRGKPVQLNPGVYAYIGSSRKPHTALTRILRHLSKNKSVRWHIDQITISDLSRALGALLVKTGSADCEFELTSLMVNLGLTYVPGFGSTDKPREVSHLFKLNCNTTNLIECAKVVYDAVESMEGLEDLVYIDLATTS